MDKVMYFFSNTIWYYATLTLLGNFMCISHERKYPKCYYWYAGRFFLSVGFLVALLHIDYSFQGIFNIFLCVLYSGVFFLNRKYRNYITGFMFGMVSTLIHYIFQWLGAYWIRRYELEWNTIEQFTFPIASTFAVVSLFILYRVFIIILCLCRSEKLNMFGIINFIVSVTFSLGFLKLIYKVRIQKSLYIQNEMLILVLLLGIVIINAYALAYSNSIFQNTVLRYRLSKEEEKNAITYEYYKNVESNYAKCKKVLHDVKNHVQVLEALYRRGQIKAAHEYAGTLVEEIDGIYPKCYSSLKILDIILQDKEMRAAKFSIRMEYQVEDVQFEQLSDFHLSIILCNLFDNAITACKKLPTDLRRISFRLRKVNSFLVIKMENPIDSVHVKEMEAKTLTHRMKTGTGLQNVKNVVKENNGNISIDISDEKFSISITFNM